MQPIPLYKRLLSYLLPVQLLKTGSTENPLLELYYYRGRYQLATIDALYSDGTAYRPLQIGFTHLAKDLPTVEEVLVLGTGLASGVQIMAKMGYTPHFTLVEYDTVILKMAMDLLPDYKGKITPVCADARQYMADNVHQHDVVVVDIFNSRIVPQFVTTIDFLSQCRNALKPGGHMILNYIIQQNEEWHRVDAIIRSVFPKCYCIDDGINRIIIATV